MTEVSFSIDPNGADEDDDEIKSNVDGLSTIEYVTIGISSLLLGLIYVASVFLYVHLRKRKKEYDGHERVEDDDGGVNKDRRIKSGNHSNNNSSNNNNNNNGKNVGKKSAVAAMEEGVIKNNPLLTLSHRHFDKDGPNCSDSGSCCCSEENERTNNSNNNNNNGHGGGKLQEDDRHRRKKTKNVSQ